MPAKVQGLPVGWLHRPLESLCRQAASHFNCAVRLVLALGSRHRSAIARVLDGGTQWMVLSAAVKHPSICEATPAPQSKDEPHDVCASFSDAGDGERTSARRVDRRAGVRRCRPACQPDGLWPRHGPHGLLAPFATARPSSAMDGRDIAMSA